MRGVDHILARHFANEQWRITTPPAGVQGEAYIAHSEAHRLFVKLDVDPRPLRRLAELGVAPPLLHSDALNGRTYAIQQFVAGQPSIGAGLRSASRCLPGRSARITTTTR